MSCRFADNELQSMKLHQEWDKSDQADFPVELSGEVPVAHHAKGTEADQPHDAAELAARADKVIK